VIAKKGMSTLTTLTNFHADPRLHDLAALLHRPQPFNILTVLGLGRQELRHSDLLAYLLDPRQPHGLGDH
jgi:PD-(D/E)XK nuclease superfamily